MLGNGSIFTFTLCNSATVITTSLSCGGTFSRHFVMNMAAVQRSWHFICGGRFFSMVHKRIDEFANGTAGAYLSKLPDSQGEACLECFIIPIWNDLLVRVHHVVGPRFQRSLAKFNTQRPKSLLSGPESSLTQVLWWGELVGSRKFFESCSLQFTSSRSPDGKNLSNCDGLGSPTV